MSGVICDRREPARVKGKVYKVAVRPAMLYGLQTVALTKRDSERGVFIGNSTGWITNIQGAKYKIDRTRRSRWQS